jgi:Asp/Glu/hydantoin racemase
MKMHLPVMDLRNKAIVNPNTTDINKAMMRCLAKCIACFGIGLYIFSGEDLPTESVEDQEVKIESMQSYIDNIRGAENLNELKVLWQDAITACGNSLELKKMINDEVKQRKSLLEKYA